MISTNLMIPMNPPAIVIDRLVKDFPTGQPGVKLRAVDHVSLSIAPGSVFGLLGPNGSGKSTTLKVVLGLLEPTAGRCTVLGHPGGSREARAAIGFLPEAPYFHRFLSGREVVALSGRLSGMRGTALRDNVQRALAQVELVEAANRRVGTYSKGMLQRLGLAQAIVHDPPLLILDEPTAGLDPVGAEALAEQIRALRSAGKTIILCSHLLEQVERLCDRLAIMHRGQVLLEGDVDNLTLATDATRLEVVGLHEDGLEDLRQWLKDRGARLESTGPVRRGLPELFRESLAGSR